MSKKKTPEKKKPVSATPTAKKGKVAKPPQAIRGHVLSAASDEPTLAALFPEIPETRKRLFLQAIAQTPRIGRACRAAGIDQKTSWNWRMDYADVVFQQAFEVAWKMGIERVEGELYRRGVEGYTVPVYHQGQLVGTEQRFSDTAAIFMLKGAVPERYAEQHRVAGPGGAPIRTQTQVDSRSTVLVAHITNEELLARMEQARSVLSANAAAQLPTQTSALPGGGPSPSEQYAAELAARKGTQA